MPSADPDPDLDAFRRRAALLLERQLRGEAPPPGEISEERLASELGLSRRRYRRIFRAALLKLQADPRTRDLYQQLLQP